jgi:hypothetical protein
LKHRSLTLRRFNKQIAADGSNGQKELGVFLAPSFMVGRVKSGARGVGNGRYSLKMLDRAFEPPLY